MGKSVQTPLGADIAASLYASHDTEKLAMSLFIGGTSGDDTLIGRGGADIYLNPQQMVTIRYGILAELTL